MLLSRPSDTLHHSVVLVHGLTGNRESTWTEHEHGTTWPRDKLPSDLPTARIMTFGYDADVVHLIDVSSQNTIRDHGKALATDLGRKRLLDGTVSVFTRCLLVRNVEKLGHQTRPQSKYRIPTQGSCIGLSSKLLCSPRVKQVILC